MFVVDTNVILHAANLRSPLHPTCSGLIDAWRKRSANFCVTWPICYEFLRVATHGSVWQSPFTSQEAIDFLNALFPERIVALTPGERHAEVLGQTLGEMPHMTGSIMHDLHVAVLMREHGVRQIYTFDTDFHRFPFLQVIDPAKRSN